MNTTLTDEEVYPFEILKETFLSEMKELECSGDEEAAHMRADAILCALLVRLGYEDIVTAFMEVHKWYS